MQVHSRAGVRFAWIGALALIAAGAAGMARAAATDPETVVKTTVNQVVAVLKDPAYRNDRAGRRARLRAVIEPHFDFGGMARSALGHHWRNITPAQREEFTRLFTKLIEASYVDKIERYDNQTIAYGRTIRDADRAEVRSRVLQEGKSPIDLNYQLTLVGGEWKVYDVTIERISLIGNYRNQFNRIVNQRGYANLIQAIKDKTTQLTRAPGE